MNIIFLDIDGVLVTERHSLQSQHYSGMQFDPICVEYLKEIIQKTNCKIVISFSWRESRNLEELIQIFNFYGIFNCIIGVTPILSYHFQRHDEIKTYLNQHKNSINQFLILDDEEPMGDLEPLTIRTSFQNGITQMVVDRILSYFK